MLACLGEKECLAHLGTLSHRCTIGAAAATLAVAAVQIAHLGRASPGGPILTVLPHIDAAPIQHLQ